MQKDEENAFGYTYGIGLTYQLSDALSLQLGQNMHRIDNRDIEYRQLHTGFVFSF